MFTPNNKTPYRHFDQRNEKHHGENAALLPEKTKC